MHKSVVTATMAASLFLGLGAATRPAAAQFYAQTNLVSDGAVPALTMDPDLVNAWGLVAGPATPWWVSDNGTGKSTLYDGSGTKRPLVVTVPGAPTGVVFNGGTGFVVSVEIDPMTMKEGPARFIFASEDGTISGWNPTVEATSAVLAVTVKDAVYKGLAIASTSAGDFLYATNFHNGTVDVFDSSFMPVVKPGAFTDPRIPKGYAPFGIRAFENVILVTYAMQDADKHDDVPGQGHGFIDMFDTAGNLLRRVAMRGQLNSPWGLALAANNFGKFSGDLLVGNFGDGRINAYNPGNSNEHSVFHHRGFLRSADHRPIVIDGLWALSFGNGAAAGPTNTLFFTAGPFGEQHGLFGDLVAVQTMDGDNNDDQ